MTYERSVEVFYNNVLKINNRKYLTTNNTDFPYFSIEQLSSFFRKEDTEILYCIFFDCLVEWQTVELGYFSQSKDYRRYSQYEQYCQFLKDLWLYPLRDDNSHLLEWFFCEFSLIYFKRVFSFRERELNKVFKVKKGKIEFTSSKAGKECYATPIEEEDPRICLLRMLRVDGLAVTKAKEALSKALNSKKK